MGERLKKVSPRPSRANVNDFFFGKTGGNVQVGMVLAGASSVPSMSFQVTKDFCEKLHERC